MQFFIQYLNLAFEIYKFLFIVYVFFSWFGGIPRNKLGYMLIDLIKPTIALCKKVPHVFGMIDLSPIYAIFLVELVRNIVFKIIFTLS